MPVFETSKPISATLDLAVGDVRLDADHRTDVVVEVRPSDPASEADIKAAEGTRVEYAAGELLVKAPQRGLFGRTGAIDVAIDLPSGSHVKAVVHRGAFRSSGRLGQCRFKTSTGDIELEETGPLVASTSFGDITVARAQGSAEAVTGSGLVRMRELECSAVIKNSNGNSWVGEVTGSLRVQAANGAISVGTAHGSVEARTANGDIEIGEVMSGSIVLGTTAGRIEVGISPGTAALLDVRTKSGSVQNSLTPTDGPEKSDRTVEVQAGTAVGDIVIHRA
ncbi:DUF4097 family beta strand repeat-containing protein [Streptomyces sp. NPDC101194]|uniref:DUF4097 family beta strand repeat-containing protein n=1 Tax=Streptomyces sp. NPDC101194 TaxID=3366127 RepID=UPI0038127C1A